MASQSEKDLSCPVCHDIFRDPVDLDCSHSFCKDCLQRWWSEIKTQTCPLCKKFSFLNDPPCNLELKNLCEAFLFDKDQKASSGSEPLCSLHAEKLKLFCLDHQQPVCVVCRDSKTHNNHRFRPIDEAAQDHREELQGSLRLLQEKLKLFIKVNDNFDKTEEHIKIQSQHTEREIKKQFRKLRQCLLEEEKARISALREEKQQKNQVIKANIAVLSREITALSDTIRVAEEGLREADVSFLQSYKTAVERVEKDLLRIDPQPVSGLLIDEAKHLGNLAFNIWNKLKEMVSFSPVILDPNTAHPELILSEDLTTVTSGQKRRLPDNPERFDQHFCVLGSEGFKAGTHSWDVEVRNEQFWSLGVLQESTQRKGQVQTGFWGICFSNGIHSAVSPPLPDKVLSVQTLERVRVQLDWDRGRVSFFDLDTNKQIHIFKQTFTERLFPYISTKNKLAFKILPMTVSVTKEHRVLSSTGFWGF
ncbi:nuclear factor 7, ovary-like [Leuresthes tenuis]|uniref:nuclear factor 7, ovary-like n=1 Tax=Leuresthes tenuis TaxID=355514 RepID=UPI003B510A33